MKQRKVQLPTHTKRYEIKLFFSGILVSAVFFSSYTDLFGNVYLNLFMDDTGKIYLLSEVQNWTIFLDV